MPIFLFPPSVGIDISDVSIKWLSLKPAPDGFRVDRYGEIALQEGVVENGVIQNVDALASTLREVKKHLGGISHVHAALPEEPAYLFELSVPSGAPRDQVLKLIEFEFEGRVPIAPKDAVFDFDVIERRVGDTDSIGVVVFPRELAERYVSAFGQAGLSLLSLEIESRSIARAICRHEAASVNLLVDFGRARSGFAVLKNGIPIFSSTVEVGGNTIDHALQTISTLPQDGLLAFKNEQGLASGTDAKAPGMEAIIGTASALADEVTKHYRYWDTRRNDRGERMTPVSQVVLVGGSANLKGLADYIAGRVQAETVIGEVWHNVCDLETYTPPIDRHSSLRYATAIGLALRAFV